MEKKSFSEGRGFARPGNLLDGFFDDLFQKSHEKSEGYGEHGCFKKRRFFHIGGHAVRTDGAGPERRQSPFHAGRDWR